MTSLTREMAAIIGAGGEPIPSRSMQRVDRKYGRVLTPQQTKCDAQGRFRFDKLPAGEWFVSIKIPQGRATKEFISYRGLVTIAKNQTNELTLFVADGTTPQWSGAAREMPSFHEELVAKEATHSTAATSSLVDTATSPPVSQPKLEPRPLSPLKRPSTFTPMLTVRKDIEQMLAVPIKKSGWETEPEFEARKTSALAKYLSPHGYQLAFKIDNPNNQPSSGSAYQQAHYDLESGTLAINMPESWSERITFTVVVRDVERVVPTVVGYIRTSTAISSSTHAAQNGFGAKITVQSYSGDVYGVAILGATCSTEGLNFPVPERDKILLKMGRDDARSALTSGSVFFNVALENRFLNVSETPLVHTMSPIFQEASLRSPVERNITQYAIPVQLLSIQVVSLTGKVLAEAPCTQIDSAVELMLE